MCTSLPALKIRVKSKSWQIKGNQKKRKVAKRNVDSTGIVADTKAATENVIENFNLVKNAIENDDKETCKRVLDKARNKNPRLLDFLQLGYNKKETMPPSSAYICMLIYYS